jgi:hypothetical protein
MTLMAGMTPRDPMAGMKMPNWDVMTMGMVHTGFNYQDGPSGDDAVEASNWGMVMAQRDLERGRITLMMMRVSDGGAVSKTGTASKKPATHKH